LNSAKRAEHLQSAKPSFAATADFEALTTGAGVNGVMSRMARRPVPLPKPQPPTLTVGQKRRRIERLQKCLVKLEEFDPQKAPKRAPAVLELEAAIDKALASAFGYGTLGYLQYNDAATLDPSPLLAETAARANGARPARHDVKVAETREQFSENKLRSISLLQKAIRTLEEEIATAEPKAATLPSLNVVPLTATQAPEKGALPTTIKPSAPAPGRSVFVTLESLRRRLTRWLKRKR
jgi:hypothetical protein